MKKRPIYDYILLIAFPVIGLIISLVFKTNFFITTVLFFLPGSIYYTIRIPKFFTKQLLFSTLMGVLPGYVIEFLAIKDDSWVINHSIFPLLPGGVSFEVVLWGIVLTYLIVISYEYFFEPEPEKSYYSNKLKLLAVVALVAIVFLFIFFFDPAYFRIPYYYFWGGLFVLFLPTLVFLVRYPRNIWEFVSLSLYFYLFLILFEFVGLQLNQWSFAGTNYISWVQFHGFTIPFEELFFTQMLITPAILTYYEFFFDDRK